MLRHVSRSVAVAVVATAGIAGMSQAALATPSPGGDVAAPAIAVAGPAAEVAALANWQSLPVDALGNRHYGKWTISPNGVQAAPNAMNSDCYSGYSCWFQNGGFTGWIQRYAQPQQTYIGAGYDDQMSSWVNRNSRDAAWYPNSSNSNPGTQHCMPANIQVSQVSGSENDTMSGFQIFNPGVRCV